jgi:tetratricopeptide (TPR) repeat protein
MPGKTEELIRAKRYREAIAEGRQGVLQNPNDSNLLYLLAVAHYFNEEYTEAAAALEQSLDTDPRSIDALLLLALLCSWGYGGGYSKATELYQNVLALNDKEVDALIGLALSRDSPGVEMTIHQSIELLNRALEIDPARPEIHNNLAYAYWEAGQYDKATLHFKHLLEISSVTSSVIRSALRALRANQAPQNTAYLGPALPRLP